MSEKLLDIQDLHVKYWTDEAEIYAVNGLSFSINSGDIETYKPVCRAGAEDCVCRGDRRRKNNDRLEHFKAFAF